jgi:hypothetical protein
MEFLKDDIEKFMYDLYHKLCSRPDPRWAANANGDHYEIRSCLSHEFNRRWGRIKGWAMYYCKTGDLYSLFCYTQEMMAIGETPSIGVFLQAKPEDWQTINMVEGTCGVPAKVGLCEPNEKKFESIPSMKLYLIYKGEPSDGNTNNT